MNWTGGAAPLEITVVEAEGCHFCSDARRAIASLSEEFPLVVRGVRVDSEEGVALVALHRPAMSPLVVLDGAFFSQGRLPRKKLEALLRRRTASAKEAVGGN